MEILDYKKFPILIVDDEKDNLLAFQYEFEENFQILSATSGNDALTLLKDQGEVSLIIVDQRMPEMKGVDLLREVYRLYPDTIRFLITAYSDVEVVIEAINSGRVYKYISKPWDHEDVRLSIMRAIESYYLTKERERLIEEKINTVKKVAESNRLASLGMLAAGIAHEINNPLVSINTFLTLLPRKLKDSSMKEMSDKDEAFWKDFYQLATSELKRVQTLIRELLNLAKPPKYEYEESNLSSLIRSELQIFESAAKEKDIRFKVEIDQDLPAIQCDRNRIKQVLLNLVINAIDATERGGQVSIIARIVTLARRLKQVEISIADTGVGIPSENLEKVFQPFFSTKKKGTGLGLVVCDLIVKQHGGEIHVASMVGKGTTFLVTLPVQSPKTEPVTANH